MPTIQGELERALWRLSGERIRVVAASRTDSGVHARGQVVSFSTGAALSPHTFVSALNFYLPPDIAVSACYRVPAEFDARGKALSREYRYTILNSATPSPLLRRFSYFVLRTLDVAAMNRAAQSLVGTHDFAAFSPPRQVGSTVRTVNRAEVSREGNLVLFDMAASSFLPQQVRRTVGALLRVGRGRMGAGEFQRLLEGGRAEFETTPARGLCLMRVNYAAGWFQDDQDL